MHGEYNITDMNEVELNAHYWYADARQRDNSQTKLALQSTQKVVLKTKWQHSEECMCRLRNIAMPDYQESVTTG